MLRGRVAHLVETIIVVVAGAAIFGSPSRLHGPLLYDDKAAVHRNPVVSGATPLRRVWDLDFWGEHELSSAESHKSFRPLVTLSYRANYLLHGHDSWGYHAVNVALHALNCALVPPTVRAAFGWREPGELRLVPGAAALLFAVHPVHVEAVQQVVGRAELLMALFFLLGFLGYASLAVGRRACSVGAAPCCVGLRGGTACLLALACTLLATLSKETGVTLRLRLRLRRQATRCRLTLSQTQTYPYPYPYPYPLPPTPEQASRCHYSVWGGRRSLSSSCDPPPYYMPLAPPHCSGVPAPPCLPPRLPPQPPPRLPPLFALVIPLPPRRPPTPTPPLPTPTPTPPALPTLPPVALAHRTSLSLPPRLLQ